MALGSAKMRTITAFVGAAVLAAFGAMLVAPVDAQVLYGSIVGQVSDSSSAVVPEATVRVIHQETNQSRVVSTTASGAYNFPTLPVGTYEVSITKNGFQTFTAQGIVVNAGQVARIDAELRPGAVAETISVTG